MKETLISMRRSVQSYSLVGHLRRTRPSWAVGFGGMPPRPTARARFANL